MSLAWLWLRLCLILDPLTFCNNAMLLVLRISFIFSLIIHLIFRSVNLVTELLLCVNNYIWNSICSRSYKLLFICRKRIEHADLLSDLVLVLFKPAASSGIFSISAFSYTAEWNAAIVLFFVHQCMSVLDHKFSVPMDLDGMDLQSWDCQLKHLHLSH